MGFSLGGLFSSSSKSSQSSSSKTENTTQTATVGDLSTGNTMVYGDYSPVGLASDELSAVLEYSSNLFDKATAQSSTALSTAATIADRSSNPTSATVQDVKPLIVWGILGLTAAYVLPKIIK